MLQLLNYLLGKSREARKSRKRWEARTSCRLTINACEKMVTISITLGIPRKSRTTGKNLGIG